LINVEQITNIYKRVFFTTVTNVYKRLVSLHLCLFLCILCQWAEVCNPEVVKLHAIHIFTMSQMICRPIIVISDSPTDGLLFSLNDCQSVYLRCETRLFSESANLRQCDPADVRIKSVLIQKSGFESRIIFG